MKRYGMHGIIFVHGIVGNNRIFDFLRPVLPDEYEVTDVTLCGHGGNALDFSRASMARWKVQVSEAVADLASHCDTVIGVGHSMGCLLLLEQAATGDRIDALFLLNPPLRVAVKPRLLVNIFKVAAGLTQNDPVVRAARDAYGVALDYNPLHYYGWPVRYFELFREIRRVRRDILPLVMCPVIFVLSRSDELVHYTSYSEFTRTPHSRFIPLYRSTHYYYTPDERVTILESFRTLL